MALKHVFFNLRDNLRFNWAKHKFGFIPEGTEADFRFAELKKVVVLKLDGKLGDTEVMTHFYSAMRKAQPRLFLCVVCPQHLAPIYKDILGFDLVLTSSRKPKEDEIKKLCAQILNAEDETTPRSAGVDLVVTTEPHFRPRDFIFDYYLKPRYVAGCDVRLKGSSINLFLFDPDHDARPISSCFCELMDKGALNHGEVAYQPLVTPEAIANAQAYVQSSLEQQQQGVSANDNADADTDVVVKAERKDEGKSQSAKKPLLLGINPCGAASSRCMKPAMVGKIIDRLVEQHQGQQMQFMLLLPESKADFVAAVINQVQHKDQAAQILRLPENTSVIDFAAFIHILDGLITVDTAAVHMACASEVPQLAFYCRDPLGVNENRWGPIGAKATLKLLDVERIEDIDEATLLESCSEFVGSLIAAH